MNITTDFNTFNVNHFIIGMSQQPGYFLYVLNVY